MSPVATRAPELDPACAEAIDLARTAAEADAGPAKVGGHVGAQADGDRVVTHVFATLDPAYAGWRWAVTVARGSRSKVVTVSECLLLPGPDALLAPPWIPWTERVRPGDLRAGDLMPASQHDERLVPFVTIAGETGLLDWEEWLAWQPGPLAEAGADGPDVAPAPAGEGAGEPAESADESSDEPAPGEASEDELPGTQNGSQGLPELRSARVLSAAGRDQAATRWHAGTQGPHSRLARSAPATCLTCGFMIKLSGPLGRVFGVCGNEFAPDDGQVVSVDHGCGAHSEGEVAAEGGALPAVDELGYDMMTAGEQVPESVLETIDHELS